MTALSILLLGNVDRAEFRDARSCLERWGTVWQCGTVDLAAAALADGGLTPDAIVVAQAYPGQFSHQDIDRLRRLSPLTRVLGLMGSWCEGEMRTGSPWPAAVRTYWHQWAARCDRELQRLVQGRNSSWALPLTATEEERLLADSTAAWPKREGLVLIHTRSPEMHDWLSAACRSRGFSTVWQRPPATSRTEGARLALFDAACLSNDEEQELRRMAARLPSVPVVALLDFPRVEDHRRALAAGAASVLSKPLAVDDLFWELDAVGVG